MKALGLLLLPAAAAQTVLNTWPFTDATDAAWAALSDGGSRLDAVEAGGTACEALQCDGTVGYGGSPDSTGETTLDAMIMDGPSHVVGSVGDLRRVKGAISVARAVMEHTEHTLLVGDASTDFAQMMGFDVQPLNTPHSDEMYTDWLAGACQPNFFANMVNDSQLTGCPPYEPAPGPPAPARGLEAAWAPARDNHDTIGLVVLDAGGDLACGTSTNGANHKVAGRVGDSPITGSGSYVDNDVGGAAATGDGDVMMRFLPAYQAVESMRRGMSPTEACEDAMLRIAAKVEAFSGGIVCLNRAGEYGAAAVGWEGSEFSYSVRSAATGGTQVVQVPSLSLA